MSAEMNLRSERTDKILDELEDRIQRLEKELARLRGGQCPDRKWQPFNQIIDLIPGDIVRLRGQDGHYNVIQVYGDHACLIKTHELTNPSAWEVLHELTNPSAWEVLR